MTKSLANKIRLKERLYTFRLDEGTPVQKYLNEFNSILVDLKSLNVKVKDEDKAILLVVSLPPSYKHFKEIMLYSNSNTLSFEDVKSNLLSKEEFYLDIHADTTCWEIQGGSILQPMSMATSPSKIPS